MRRAWPAAIFFACLAARAAAQDASTPAAPPPSPSPATTAPTEATPNAAPDNATPTTPSTPAPLATPSTTAPAPGANLEKLVAADARSILGKDVSGTAGEDMGLVVDVLFDANKEPRAVVIDFGGFLGVGTRKIAVAWHLLQVYAPDSKTPLKLDLSRADVQSAPEYKAGDKTISVIVAPGVVAPAAPPPAATPPAATPPTSAPPAESEPEPPPPATTAPEPAPPASSPAAP